MRFMVTLTPKADLGDPISQLLGAEQPRWQNCDKLAFLSTLYQPARSSLARSRHQFRS